jgi:chitinase
MVLAALPALACVSGLAEPFGDSPDGPNDSAGSPPGSAAGSSSGPSGHAGAGPGAGGTTTSSLAGQPSTAGNGAGGVSSQAGSSSGGSAGTAPVEVCDFPAWMAGHDYAAGDKVIYQGKAFIANEANPGYDPLISTFFWSPYSCEVTGSGGSSGSGGTGPTNTGDCVLGKLLPSGESSYHSMFIPPWQGHQEKALYSYSALCTALKTPGLGAFASSGNAEADKRELAAFFAHVAKETAFLEQTDEAGQPSSAQDYHGRGAIQLTGQSNYQAAADFLGKNLVANPGLVSTDAVTNWQVALWFWVVHNNPGTAGVKNCHQAIQSGDFAQTTRIINGGIECPGSESAQKRAQYYTSNCNILAVSPGGNLVC